MRIVRLLALPIAASFLASCGSSSVGLASIAPVAAPPPPSSTSVTGPAGFYAMPVDEDLATYAGGVANSVDGPRVVKSFGADEIIIDYNPATKDYTIAVPGHVAGRAVENTVDATPDGQSRHFDLISPSNDRVGWVSVATHAGFEQKYTAIGSFAWGDNLWFVTGIPTPRHSVPVTGSATFDARVEGWSTEGTNLRGKMVLNFEFARALLNGSMSLTANDGTGRYVSIGDYRIADGILPLGSNSFSGRFFNPRGLTANSMIEGSLMGPDASEVGGRWKVPIRLGEGFHPSWQGDYSAAGVFVGRRR